MGEEHLSRKSKLIRELVSEFNQNAYLREHFVGDHRGISDFDKDFDYPEHLLATRYSMPEFKMEYLENLNREEENNLCLLQLHGGGYVGSFKTHYRRMAGLYSEVSGGAPVLSLDYRVAPEHPFPAALYDALCAFDWLCEKGFAPEQIVLCGDSAGGGLAMAVVHYLIDRDRRLPGGICAMSPWTDLTAGGESYKKNYEIDPVFGNAGSRLIYENPYTAGFSAKHPYISPVFGDFTGFPPMLIQVGSCEMLLDDAKTVAKKAKQAGVKVRYSEYEGMFHVFQVAAKLMEESRRAWAEIGAFMRALREEKNML